MSSTSRGAEREPSDYYVTPIEPVKLFLAEWAKDEPQVKSFKAVLDPCAGGTIANGKITVAMSYPAAIGDILGMATETMDIRDDSPADIVCDYLASHIKDKPDLIISNPPFNLASRFIGKALDDVADGGFVVFLLRLNFFGSAARKEMMQTMTPSACYVHSERMGFKHHLTHLPAKERRATDSIEYAHFVWQKGIYPKWTKTRVI